MLEQYDWPGNIRQLENVIERTVIMTEKNLVSVQDIEQILKDESHIESKSEHHTFLNHIPAINGRPYARVQEQERQDIILALQQSGGNKTQAAKQLGLTARQLHYRLDKLDIHS